MPRVEPLKPHELDDDQREALKHHFVNGELYNVFGVFVRNTRMFKRHQVYADYIMRRSALPPRERELVILRIGYLNRSEYEFAHHARMGLEAGLTEAEVRRVAVDPASPEWSPFDRALIEAVDAIKYDMQLSDDLYARLSERYSVNQMIDLVMTVGNYNMVSTALNIFGVELEESVPRVEGIGFEG
jgi:4-carboxymuconolactone decarboxylase